MQVPPFYHQWEKVDEEGGIITCLGALTFVLSVAPNSWSKHWPIDSMHPQPPLDFFTMFTYTQRFGDAIKAVKSRLMPRLRSWGIPGDGHEPGALGSSATFTPTDILLGWRKSKWALCRTFCPPAPASHLCLSCLAKQRKSPRIDSSNVNCHVVSTDKKSGGNDGAREGPTAISPIAGSLPSAARGHEFCCNGRLMPRKKRDLIYGCIWKGNFTLMTYLLHFDWSCLCRYLSLDIWICMVSIWVAVLQPPTSSRAAASYFPEHFLLLCSDFKKFHILILVATDCFCCCNNLP